MRVRAYQTTLLPQTAAVAGEISDEDLKDIMAAQWDWAFERAGIPEVRLILAPRFTPAPLLTVGVRADLPIRPEGDSEAKRPLRAPREVARRSCGTKKQSRR